MKRYNRIFFKDNTVINDLSSSLGDYVANTEAIDIVAAEDAIYIGSYLPWNHRYIDISVANDQASVLSVEIWDGNSWEAAVDVVDETSVGGKTLARPGFLYFTVDKNKTWGREPSTEDITALSSLFIYNMYWARFTWNNDLKATTALNYIGWKFSNDAELQPHYPDLLDSELLDSYKSGKTDWDEQHFSAADLIIQKLQSRQDIWNSNQILEPSRFLHASIQKTAEIIFNALGDDYNDQKKSASSYYHAAINSPVKDIDRNEDGHQQPAERRGNVGIRRT